MPAKKKLRLVGGHRMNIDQEMHLVENWCLDAPVKWHRRLDFPFRDAAHRREVWKTNREHLIRKYAPAPLAAQVDYEGVVADSEQFPSVVQYMSGPAVAIMSPIEAEEG